MDFPKDFEKKHKRLMLRHGTFASAKDLTQYHDKLFWNNSEKDVFQLLESLEWQIFEEKQEKEGFKVSEVFKKNIQQIWKIYATEATCIAPPWRNCVARTEISEKEATKHFYSTLLLLEDNPPSISKHEVELIENYKIDFHRRFFSAAKKNDDKFNAAATIGTAVVGFAAATILASRKN